MISTVQTAPASKSSSQRTYYALFPDLGLTVEMDAENTEDACTERDALGAKSEYKGKKGRK